MTKPEIDRIHFAVLSHWEQLEYCDRLKLQQITAAINCRQPLAGPNLQNLRDLYSQYCEGGK